MHPLNTPDMLTPEAVALLLDGRDYRHEITPDEEAACREAGIVVVFGASDDLVELRGAIHDERGAGGRTTLRITAAGLLKDWDEVEHDDEEACERYFKQKGRGHNVIDVRCWCPDDILSWEIDSDIPHFAFLIFDDGERYCRGIAFRLADARS